MEYERTLLIVAIAAALTIGRDAHAVEPSPDPRVFSASPESATMSIGWRSQLRGRAGATIPFAGGARDVGFALRLPAFIELHNFKPSAVPYQLWRGRLVLDGSWQWRVGAECDGPWVVVGLSLEHESDHSSESALPGFLNLNSTALHVDVLTTLGPAVTFFASALGRLHLLTCTTDPRVCAEGGGGRGSRTIETAVEATVTGAFAPLHNDAIPMLFVSTFGSLLLPHELARSERRVTVEAGGALATGRRGTFQLFVASLFGDDVGYLRARESVVEMGGGLRWTP